MLHNALTDELSARGLMNELVDKLMAASPTERKIIWDFMCLVRDTVNLHQGGETLNDRPT